MKRSRLSWFVLLLIEAGFLGYVAYSAGDLPERVASHFNAAGTANGWMARAGYLRFIALFGIAFPLLWAVGLPLLLRVTPASLWNLPNRDYWLAPDRRRATEAWVSHQLRWFACLSLGFTAGIHASVVRANTLTPPHLGGLSILGVTGLFLLAGVAWTFVFWRRFSHPPSA